MRCLWTGPLLLAVLVLTGCDAKQRFAGAEDRINAAVPISADLRLARERLGELSGEEYKAERATLDAAWTARMRARATSCSPDYTPSWRQSADEVRVAVSNKNCFAEFDQKLLRWVGVQRVRLLLAMSPAAVGNVPPSITLQGQQARLSRHANRAPVAAVASAEGVELIALDDGRRLFNEKGSRGEVDVAPNGRVFAQYGTGSVRLRATEGGETLLELPDAAGVYWLGSWFLGVRSAAGKTPYVLSLRSAAEAPVAVQGSSSVQALLPAPAPEGSSRFNVLTFLGLQQYEVSDQNGALKLTLTAEKPGTDPRLIPITSRVGQLSADAT